MQLPKNTMATITTEIIGINASDIAVPVIKKAAATLRAGTLVAVVGVVHLPTGSLQTGTVQSPGIK